MRFIICVFIIAVVSFSCTSSTSSESKYNPPADHSKSIDGAKHKPGHSNPELNCISCHGNTLRGGTSGVSCYECHGKKW